MLYLPKFRCLNRFFYDHIECVADFSSCTQRDFDRIEDLRGEMNELEVRPYSTVILRYS